jgi:uncharacterized damage-inducible protein DinB
MLALSFDDLTAYTKWERDQWRSWFKQHRDDPLRIPYGPHGDGRLGTVGDVVRHIFSAEKRYIERQSGLPLTDPASISNENSEVLFRFGETSRKELEEFVATFPAGKWDVQQELKFPHIKVTGSASPRKIVIHVLMHEIRHWAQIATVLRLNGLVDQWHDFIISPVMGDGFSLGQK